MISQDRLDQPADIRRRYLERKEEIFRQIWPPGYFSEKSRNNQAEPTITIVWATEGLQDVAKNMLLFCPCFARENTDTSLRLDHDSFSYVVRKTA